MTVLKSMDLTVDRWPLKIYGLEYLCGMNPMKDRLRNLLVLETNRLQSLKDLAAPQVSKASIGWHLSHMLLVAKLMLQKLNTSDPHAYQPDINLYRTWYLLIGSLPRGKAKAPKTVNPETFDELPSAEKLLADVEELLKHDVHPRQYVKHPYFGMLRRNLTYRFLSIHTKHHLKIVNEILSRQCVK